MRCTGAVRLHSVGSATIASRLYRRRPDSVPPPCPVNAGVIPISSMITKLPSPLERQALSVFDDCAARLTDLIGESTMAIGEPGIRIASSGPTIDIAEGHFTLLVGPNALHNDSTLTANVAHETVHLHLSNGSFGDACGLEEGFATNFELETVTRMHGAGERQTHLDCLPRSYRSVLADFEHLSLITPNPIAVVRQTHSAVTGISQRILRTLFPGLGLFRAFRLARCRRMRAG